MSFDDLSTESKLAFHLPWHIIWIMAMLEALTVPLLLSSGQPMNLAELKSPLMGFLIGAAGCLVVLLVMNLIFRRIKVLNLVILSIWGGSILCLLFLCQGMVRPYLPILPNWMLGMILGFIPTFIGISCISFIYNELPFAKIKVLISDVRYCITDFSIFSIALIISLYEVVALPTIWISYAYFGNAILSGALGGLAGALIVYCLQLKPVMYFKKLM